MSQLDHYTDSAAAVVATAVVAAAVVAASKLIIANAKVERCSTYVNFWKYSMRLVILKSTLFL